MAMDREAKAAFSSVNGRLDKVDERIDKLTGIVTRLAEGQDELRQAQQKTDASLARAAGLINTLAGEVAQLTHAQQQTTGELRHLGERMDGYARDVVRGFSEAVKRDSDLAARVELLEHRQP